ncbi:MAG TPA: polyribonucleotide nucleotidyltransferase [Candidatus Saccharimonadales bacterium]|nr:polyribonucleotide nucleotidyltransferase [Candidatus Saccharimonadales bacterium]
MDHKMSIEVGGRTLTLETGRMAKQASGSVTVQFGETVVLAAVVADKTPSTRDFFPLTVEYREKTYAAGKIPGGFFKREGRPTEKEILSSRLIDRPLRPLFDKAFNYEIQIFATVLSSDQENDSDVLGLIGASAAIMVSDIPFPEPVGAVRIGRVNGELIVNPTFAQLEESELDVVVAATRENIIMVEGGCREVGEEVMLQAMRLGFQEAQPVIDLQHRLREAAGKPKRSIPDVPDTSALEADIRARCAEAVRAAGRIALKEDREKEMSRITEEATAALAEAYPDLAPQIPVRVEELEREELRRAILEEDRRADGRDARTIRPITCEVGVLPRTHGSALFTRGQTQALAVCTLGTSMDEQRVEELEGQSWKSYMLHYNFPPFSVGEVRPLRGPGRREIGHGALAERAIEPVIPADEIFPYTIRLVSEILESNGSSSMATVCGSSLALMDAGCPIKAPVAGIAMGLVKEGDRVAVLSDILGVEDHLGDMDFKVTGTRAGVTAFQMDVKIAGIGFELIERALEQARQGRLHILGIMEQTLASPRQELSVYAPRILVHKIDPEKIREVIGSGGKVIKRITEQTGAQIDIEDDGTVKIASYDSKGGESALAMIRAITEDPEIGKVFTGTVRRITTFGAFVEIVPGKDGLVHISELEPHRVARVEDVCAEGDKMLVKVIGIDKEGKIKLSRKQALAELAEAGAPRK